MYDGPGYEQKWMSIQEYDKYMAVLNFVVISGIPELQLSNKDVLRLLRSIERHGYVKAPDRNDSASGDVCMISLAKSDWGMLNDIYVLAVSGSLEGWRRLIPNDIASSDYFWRLCESSALQDVRTARWESRIRTSLWEYQSKLPSDAFVLLKDIAAAVGIAASVVDRILNTAPDNTLSVLKSCRDIEKGIHRVLAEYINLDLSIDDAVALVPDMYLWTRDEIAAVWADMKASIK